MREFSWTWHELRATPQRVRKDMLRCIGAVNTATREVQERGGKPAAGVEIDITQLPGYVPPPDE